MVSDSGATASQRTELQVSDQRPLLRRIGGWFADHLRVCGEATTYLGEHLLSSFVVWLMIGTALAMPGLLWLGHANVSALSQDWEGPSGVTVYFEMGTPMENIDNLRSELLAQAQVKALVVTTPEQALEALVAQSSASSAIQEAIAATAQNPLPPSADIFFANDPSYLDIDRLARQLRARSDVETVVIEKTWLERMANIRQLIDRLGITLALLFSSAAVLITLAAVRLAIESRLDEIRVLALVGATRGQLRRPFLYFGAMYGFGGGLVATMILAVALNSVEEPLGSLFASYGLAVQISGFDLIFLVCSGLGALVLGVVGAWLALRQRLGVINDMSVRSA